MSLNKIAKKIRRNIIKIAHLSKSPHVGSALSCADILTVLYFSIMKISQPISKERDYFILSKAHGAMALYATLHEKGFISEQVLLQYYQNNGSLPAHTDRFTNDFIEISAGSLGHGLPIGVGMAYSVKLNNDTNKVFVLIGDGEMQEGSIWEAAMVAPKLNVNNLTVLIDHNNLQGYGRATELVEFYPIKEKWESFGWDAVVVNGHDYNAMKKAILKESNKPKAIICKTVKGKGVSFMEDKLIWHYYIVTDEHREKALKELT